MSGFSPTRVCIFFLAALATAPWTSSQAASQRNALTLLAGNDSVVRFFYQPPDGEYFHHALLFRAVKKGDPRRNTVAYSDVGRTAYISLSDMERLMTRLARLSLRWDQSATIESLETYKTIHSYGYGMGIKVLSANGTAKSLIAPDKICETLHSLDGALLTPRALWEFQGFRLQYHCRVPSYNPDAYPE
jgi:hypothetical protein